MRHTIYLAPPVPGWAGRRGQPAGITTRVLRGWHAGGYSSQNSRRGRQMRARRARRAGESGEAEAAAAQCATCGATWMRPREAAASNARVGGVWGQTSRTRLGRQPATAALCLAAGRTTNRPQGWTGTVVRAASQK
eukprot:365664-Chlamydomonas_euryale.AAC.20